MLSTALYTTEEPFTEGGESLGFSLFRDELQIPDYDWEKDANYRSETVETEPIPTNLAKKRKSVEITAPKGFGTSAEGIFEPLPFHRTKYDMSEAGEPSIDVALLSELVLNEPEENKRTKATEDFTRSKPSLNSNVKIEPAKMLTSPRRSEDWGAKPLERQSSFFDEMNRKRQKWSKSEIKLLWTSIAIHGNNWSLVNDLMSSRSYYQIKDKGRRVLYEHGWVTGRVKKDAEEAKLAAKDIAQRVVRNNNWNL